MSESNLFINADALDRGAEGLADSVVAGLSSAASEALGDPIVRALMAADGVDRAGLEGCCGRRRRGSRRVSMQPAQASTGATAGRMALDRRPA